MKMENDVAIWFLNRIYDVVSESHRIALDVAINALERQKQLPSAHTGWISVAEALPKLEERVLVTTMTKKGRTSINLAYLFEGTWHGQGSMANVTAWMPLPDPYKQDKKR